MTEVSSSSSDPKFDLASKIDNQLSHVWMVRAFLKHADESVEDEELADIVRDLQDFLHTAGTLDEGDDPAEFLQAVKKKLRKLNSATEMYESIQPDVSSHANFVMAARSLRLATDVINAALDH